MPAAAQLLNGALVGTVTDQSEAVIPGASVTVTNTGTGQVWNLSASAEGAYTLSSIAPGTYDVSASSDGFRTVTRRGVTVQAGSTVRVNVALEVGAVAEVVEVSAEAATLQTDSMEVQNEITSSELQNVPIPVTRNFQNLMVTVPGVSPPRNAHSISANPSRSLMMNANGSTAQSVAVRVDGATTWNSWLPHVGGYVPALEAIDNVNIQSGSYDADLGFAGGAAVNVSIKSGTNEIHGSAFEYHNNQHLKARPYFLPDDTEQNKRILNQFGGTIGGPIVKNRLFYFVSYEGTLDRQSSFRLATVPTTAMKTGDMSASNRPIFDPLTGNASGAGRTAFANNVIPTARISPIMQKLVGLTPDPNTGSTFNALASNNFYSNGAFVYDRHVFDTKFNFHASDRLDLSARISRLDWNFLNPALYGELGGPGVEGRGTYDGEGLGDTLSMTYSAVYTIKPNLIFDGYFGYTMIENAVENTRLDENLGLDFLGIPGTNGTSRDDGGWPGFAVPGYQTFGRANSNSPWSLKLPQAQYTTGLAWIRNKHNIRFGWDALWIAMDGNEPAGQPGLFTFNREVTGTVGTPTNDYNSYSSFLLGLPNSTGKTVRLEIGKTRSWANSLYIRDRWQMTAKTTMSLGLRWDYFSPPTRTEGRGLEVYDFNSNTLTLCGYGSVSQDCGFSFSKKMFSPRIGIAHRPTDTMVIRAGYGITWDPVNVGRNALQTYPILSGATFPAANNYQFVSTIAEGIPAVSPPDLGDGVITPPGTVSLELTDPNFRRSYIQSWNFMVEKQLGSGWIAEAGYVGNRAVRLQNRWNANYGSIGGGTASQVLNQRFGRVATTNFFSDAGGFSSRYDSLQSNLQKRLGSSSLLKFTYTWSKALGPRGNENGVDGYTNANPAYWPLISKVVRGFDRTHNFNTLFATELPFGAGKRFATSGPAAAILGGWQVNGLLTMYTGGPFSVTSSGAALNAPGNGQLADQIKPEVEIFGSRDLWFDTSAYRAVTEARFGNSGWDQLRGPGMINMDLSVYRKFDLSERINLQFRAEAFNLSNTPHFSNPRSDISSANPGLITGIANTGREGIDERTFRFALRLGF